MLSAHLEPERIVDRYRKILFRPQVGLGGLHGRVAQEHLNLLEIHYGYNQLIRHARLAGGNVTFTRSLRPSITEEERIPVLCATRACTNRSRWVSPPSSSLPSVGQNCRLRSSARPTGGTRFYRLTGCFERPVEC